MIKLFSDDKSQRLKILDDNDCFFLFLPVTKEQSQPAEVQKVSYTQLAIEELLQQRVNLQDGEKIKQVIKPFWVEFLSKSKLAKSKKPIEFDHPQFMFERFVVIVTEKIKIK